MSVKITKQDGRVIFANELYLDSIVEDSDIVEEDFIPPERLAPTQEDLAEMARIQTNNEARQYLAETDWYAIRNTETGVEIPADILTKRQEARDSVTKENN